MLCFSLLGNVARARHAKIDAERLQQGGIELPACVYECGCQLRKEKRVIVFGI